MKRNVNFSLVLIGSFFLIACNGNSTVESDLTEDVVEEEKVQDPITVSWTQLEGDSIDAGTPIILEGYIGDIGSYIDQSGGTIRIPVYERRNQTAGFKLNLYVPIGNGSNQMKELPAEFAPEDIQITCDDNSVITVGARVRITATKQETYTDGFITADVIRIEPVDDNFNAEILTSAVPLEDEMTKDTSLLNVYCYVDGKLEIPSIVFSYTNEISLDFKGSPVKEISTVYVRLGDGPSTMNDLPDNYTSKDLIVRDYNGKEIKYGVKVRLYGTWERYSFETTTPGRFYLEEIEVRK